MIEPHPSSPSVAARLTARAEPCPAHPWVPLLAHLLAGGGEASALTLGERFPLFLTLLLLAHPKTGLVLAEKQSFAAQLGTDEATVNVWLRDLEHRALLEVREGGPYLVIAVRSWPGRSVSRPSSPARNGAQPIASPAPGGSPSTPPPAATPLRYAEINARDDAAAVRPVAAVAVQRELQAGGRGMGVRGPGSEGEGWRADFARRLADVLGPAELTKLEALVAKHPRPVLEDALRRVAATPRAEIRKSPAALFAYLVRTLSARTP